MRMLVLGRWQGVPAVQVVSAVGPGVGEPLLQGLRLVLGDQHPSLHGCQVGTVHADALRQDGNLYGGRLGPHMAGYSGVCTAECYDTPKGL